MEKAEMKDLLKKVNDRLLHLNNDSIEETCPIGIIDFDKWEWPQGVGLYGMYQYYQRTGDVTVRDQIVAWFRARIAEGLPERNVNTTVPMLTLAGIAWELQDEEFQALCTDWVQWVMTQMIRTPEGGIQHVVSGEMNEGQLWDDTLFMTVLFLAKMGVLLDREDYKQEAYYQFFLHAKYLLNTENGLWYHGWSFNGRHNFAKALWARGNCWITAGIPELIEILKPEGAYKTYLQGLLRSQADTLEKLQAPSGLWHTLLDDESSYEESSAAAGFAYGILKGIHMGLLPEKFRAAAMRAVQGVTAQIDEDGTVGLVSYGTGMGSTLQHYRDIPLCPMAYGQSLTLMMLNEALAEEEPDFVIYGDSISTTEFGGGGYPAKLQKELGLKKVCDYAISATCLADTLPDSGIEILKKAENRHRSAGTVILWYGTNDWYFGNPIGEEDSRDTGTFCGALNEAIRLLRETNPDVKIILPTPTLRYQAADGGSEMADALYLENKAGLAQKPYTDAIKKIGAREGCLVIDMREATGFTLEDMEKYYPDGVHPSAAGYDIVTKIFADAVR